MKLGYDQLLSKLAVNFKLRPYSQVVELFVMSQMEGTGEGMVQMDYEEFEEALLRMAFRITYEPR